MSAGGKRKTSGSSASSTAVKSAEKTGRIEITQVIPFVTTSKPASGATRCTYRVTPEALAFLKDVKSPFGVLSLVGKYRTGKSALLNRVILELPAGQGFGVGLTPWAQTKGLWLFRGVVHCESTQLNVLVIDTEGLDSMETNGDSTHDITTFALAWLLSTTMCYNMMGSIDARSLQTLKLVRKSAICFFNSFSGSGS